MSNSLAIGAVTAVMKALLEASGARTEVETAVGGQFTLSAKPPDQLADDNTNRLNLFLFQARENPALRNSALPSRSVEGDRLTNPPLALDMTVLVTAYGEQDFFAEILLGYALHVFHESPVLTRGRIRSTLEQTPPNPNWPSNFDSTGLADQFEQLKIVPKSLGAEEMARVWASFQTGYRPTALFEASAVLIEATHPSHSSLPVISIGEVVEELVEGVTVRREMGVAVQADLTPPLPTLEKIATPDDRPAIVLGDPVTLQGYHLEAPVVARLRHDRLDAPIEISSFTKTGARELEFTLPDQPADWPPGFYRLEVDATRSGILQTTNQLAFALAPVVPGGGISAVRRADDSLEITVNPKPQIRPDQDVVLMIGSTVIPATARSDLADPLVFDFPALAAKSYFFRLRVDGVESLLIDYASSPLQFDPTQAVTIPI